MKTLLPASPKQTTKTDKTDSRRGRPPTRNREVFMLAIWRAVQEEIHVRNPVVNGHPLSVRKACERLFFERADELLKFVSDGDAFLIDIITNSKRVGKRGISGKSGAETLRQRYQTAERCRHDAARFPYLYARSRHLLEILPGTHERCEAGLAELERYKKVMNNTG